MMILKLIPFAAIRPSVPSTVTGRLMAVMIPYLPGRKMSMNIMTRKKPVMALDTTTDKRAPIRRDSSLYMLIPYPSGISLLNDAIFSFTRETVSMASASAFFTTVSRVAGWPLAHTRVSSSSAPSFTMAISPTRTLYPWKFDLMIISRISSTRFTRERTLTSTCFSVDLI